MCHQLWITTLLVYFFVNTTLQSFAARNWIEDLNGYIKVANPEIKGVLLSRSLLGTRLTADEHISCRAVLQMGGCQHVEMLCKRHIPPMSTLKESASENNIF